MKPEPCHIKLLPEPELLLKNTDHGHRIRSSDMSGLVNRQTYHNPGLASTKSTQQQSVKFDGEDEESLLAPKHANISTTDVKQNVQIQQQLVATEDQGIFEVLHEYIRVTNLLVSDAVMMRRPHLERDERLIRNGFLKQARLDFLKLRQECMTDQHRKELARKERRKALLAKKKAKKAKQKAAKKAKAEKKAKKAAEALAVATATDDVSGDGVIVEGCGSVEPKDDVEKKNDEGDKTDEEGVADDTDSRPNTPGLTDGDDTDGLADTASCRYSCHSTPPIA